MDEIALWVGRGVLLFCGVAVVCIAAWWAVDRVLRFWMNAYGIYNVAVHARKHGLDLRTGKPFSEDERLG